MRGGGGIMYSFDLSKMRSPFPIPDSTPSLHPNSSRIMERLALQKTGVDEAIMGGALWRPLNTAGHSNSFPFPARAHKMQMDMPISRSAEFTPDMTSISPKGMSCPITNADAQADEAFWDHFPPPRPSSHFPRASRAFDCGLSSASSINSSGGGYNASTCKTKEASTFSHGFAFFRTIAKSNLSPSCIDFGAPPDEKMARIDRIVA
mmetsp:Transcript_3428/g.7552  ORF Transcript_3428/g.7552 Transcript_3428/m.7552 type:complete len:206 (+) Transcript_3428:2906-3523(+)